MGKCSKHTKKCYHGWTPGPGAWPTDKSPECCRNAVKEMVIYFSKLLTKHDIKHWMDFGTLLGAVRENGIIQWDKDADFGIFTEDVEEVLSFKEEVQSDGFDMSGILEPGVFRLYYSKENRNQLDVFYWKNINHIMVSEHNLNRNKMFPSYFVNKFSKVNFYNNMISAPFDTEKFLEYRFGDWRKPKRRWDKNSHMTLDEITQYCLGRGWNTGKMLL